MYSVRKNKEKWIFLWFFAHLFVTFRFARRYYRSKYQRKTSFPLVLCSLIRNFAAENETDDEKTYCIVDAVGSIPANVDVVVVSLS